MLKKIPKIVKKFTWACIYNTHSYILIIIINYINKEISLNMIIIIGLVHILKLYIKTIIVQLRQHISIELKYHKTT